MAVTREEIARIVLDSVAQIGEELDHQGLAKPDEETPLFGDKAGLDSIALVSLVAEIESRLAEEAGVDLALADDSAMSAARSPFRRVGVLIDFIKSKA